jgi:beta-lactamase regulating signal transducer with metallopeptidase domain
MNALATLPPSAELLVKLTALLALAWIFKPVLSRANPRWQVLYWRGVAATALVLPLVVLFGPTVPVPLLNGDPAEAETVASGSAVSEQRTPVQGLTLPDQAGASEVAVVAREMALAAGIASMPIETKTSIATEVRSRSTQPSRRYWVAIVAVAWLLPAAFLLAGTLITEWRTARLVRRAKAAPEAVTEELARVARTLGFARSIRACVSSQIDSPLVTGLIRPSIVLPETFDTHDQTDLRGIFAHEVNHLASYDLIWSRVIQFLSIGFWFHPLMWGLGRQHLGACERASDAAAAAYVGDAGIYAGTLARVALGVIGHRRIVAGIAMARTPRIHERLLRLSKAKPAPPLRRRHVIPVCAGGLILLTAMGGLRLVEASSPAPGPEARPADAGTQPEVSLQPSNAAEAEKAAPNSVTEYECTLVDIVSRAPVAGATVTVQRRISGGGKSFKQWPMKRLTDYTTDADGRYTIDIRAEETAESHLYVEIRTKHPDYVDYYGGYSYSMIKKNLKMGSEPFFKSLGIWPAVKLTGTVVTPDGNPAAGVDVFGYSKFAPEESRPRGFFMEGKTNDDGTFELNAVRGGKSVVWLSPKDYCPSTHVFDPRMAELGKSGLDYLQLDVLAPDALAEAIKTRDLGRFVLEEGIKIQGRVVDVDGKPVEGVWVNASLREGSAKKEIGMNLADHIDRSALTDAEGRYRMGPLPPSTYRVNPWDEPRQRSFEDRTPRPVAAEFFTQTVTLEEGTKVATVDFQAVPHATIVAQYYRSSGETRSGHEFSLTGRLEGEFYWKRCRPDANGRVEFTAPIGLENASLNLITNEHTALRHRVTKDGPLLNEHRVELGTISTDMKEIAIIRYVAPILLIKAVDDKGELIKDAWVKLEYAPDQAPLGGGEYIRNDRPSGHVSLEEHGDGRWRTSQLLPDEEFTLTVEADGYETNSQKLSLPEGETREIAVALKKTPEDVD